MLSIYKLVYLTLRHEYILPALDCASIVIVITCFFLRKYFLAVALAVVCCMFLLRSFSRYFLTTIHYRRITFLAIFNAKYYF